MPKSALPPHLQDIENNFPDDSQYDDVPVFGKIYRYFNKATKTWFAFSYRCTERWARWRKFPKTLFAIGGNGPWRIETAFDDAALDIVGTLWLVDATECYLSRVQYWKRWHFAVQWPLMVSFHFYPKAEDVPSAYAPHDSQKLKGKLWFFYWNHFDRDLVYWMVTSLYLGRNWK